MALVPMNPAGTVPDTISRLLEDALDVYRYKLQVDAGERQNQVVTMGQAGAAQLTQAQRRARVRKIQGEQRQKQILVIGGSLLAGVVVLYFMTK